MASRADGDGVTSQSNHRGQSRTGSERSLGSVGMGLGEKGRECGNGTGGEVSGVWEWDWGRRVGSVGMGLGEKPRECGNGTAGEASGVWEWDWGRSLGSVGMGQELMMQIAQSSL
ncbi:hypothetical protein chiPu_0002035 [Chiloscyllium punctatum]|uniref:Uncharacterized protein n=1 Tax=Chiloscyllium punctatum TaxID=137246 RepID=A0A401RZQ2_CHIPU|nr:hypothetical protein [Chiloscyllium punctatum]